MAGRVEWHGDRFLAEVEMLIRQRISDASEHLADAVRRNIDTPTAQSGPSLPGEYPHRDTGELRESIESLMIGSDGYVQATAPHAMYVEISRPYLRRTFYEEFPNLRRILEGR